jgi:putative CocE/NonD family hydrolase
MKKALRLAVLISVALSCFAQTVQPAPAPAKTEVFNRSEVMVAMRDGIRLQTAVFVPKNAKGPLPILLRRTPYGVPPDEKVFVESGAYDELNADGYIFVVQNIRGRFGSEGQFVMVRPLRDQRDPKSVDESTDAYDTIEWLVKNVPNNTGRVGIFGVSYDGWTTVMALVAPHPALKAASEQASPDDMFIGDDFHHNGAFRLDYGFEYATSMESDKGIKRFGFDRYDLYDWYLNLGALSNANERYLHGSIPTWDNFVKHPNYDFFWRVRAFDPYLRITTVPNLNVAGWWDQEDFYGPQRIYDLFERSDFKHLNFFVAGPWNHGGWVRSAGDHLGAVSFGSETGKYFRANIQALWFRYWLHGGGKLPLAEAMTFQTGTNAWKTYDRWPPTGFTARKLYFQNNGKLAFDAPKDSGDAFDSYVSDPANPVPYRPRPIVTTNSVEWREWLVQDQRFVDHRPDVLSWQTDPLAEDVTVTGDIVADLFASTSGTDADWVVKLIDVFPDNFKSEAVSGGKKENKSAIPGGYQLIIADEVFRARYRNSFEKPEPVPADEVLEYKIDLHTNDHVFLAGHRIMVQVQSTWFPLIDRNPQKYVDNIYKATDADYVKATQHIYRSAEAPSAVVLPVVGGIK